MVCAISCWQFHRPWQLIILIQKFTRRSLLGLSLASLHSKLSEETWKWRHHSDLSNTDTSLIQILYSVSLVSVLERFDCIILRYAAAKGLVLKPFWSERGYRFCTFLNVQNLKVWNWVCFEIAFFFTPDTWGLLFSLNSLVPLIFTLVTNTFTFDVYPSSELAHVNHACLFTLPYCVVFV